MKTTDPSLQAAADAAVAFAVPPGPEIEGFKLADFVTAVELEQLLAVVRAAIAAPVLALHQPGDLDAGQALCRSCSEPYPCPTVRALGVTG